MLCTRAGVSEPVRQHLRVGVVPEEDSAILRARGDEEVGWMRRHAGDASQRTGEVADFLCAGDREVPDGPIIAAGAIRGVVGCHRQRPDRRGMARQRLRRRRRRQRPELQIAVVPHGVRGGVVRIDRHVVDADGVSADGRE